MQAVARLLAALQRFAVWVRAYRPTRPRLALGLLAGGMVANYVWQAAPPAMQADLWNASKALLVLGLLGLVVLAWQCFEVAAAASLLAVFELEVVGASFAWLVHPWEVKPGEEQLSALLRLPLGLIGALFAVYLAGYLYRATTEGRHD